MNRKEIEFRTDKFNMLGFKLLSESKKDIFVCFKKGSKKEEMTFEGFIDKLNEGISDSDLQLKIVSK